ncbi:unnamed protein product, partial [Ectocarpus sp. 12 AP-2014]
MRPTCFILEITVGKAVSRPRITSLPSLSSFARARRSSNANETHTAQQQGDIKSLHYFSEQVAHHISQEKRQTGPNLRACTRKSRRQSQERKKPQSVTPALAKTGSHRNKTGGVGQGSQTANPLSFQAAAGPSSATPP